MDNFGKLFEEVNKNAPKGMQIEVARQSKSGQMVSAKPQELATLSTKSRIASTAQLLQKLSKEEKLTWALETKEEANQLYREKRFAEAMERYVEALTATNFGKSDTKNESKEGNEQIGAGNNKYHEVEDVTGSEYDDESKLKMGSDGDDIGDEKVKDSDNNVDNLVVPVLCNLAACCVELQQWAKVVLFVEQVLQLRPLCRKAYYRQGVAMLHLNEYSLAIKSLETSLETTSSPSTTITTKEETEQVSTNNVSKANSDQQIKEVMPLTENERAKVKMYLQKAKEARKKELIALDKRKNALQKAFGFNSKSPTDSTLNSTMTMMNVERQINDDGEETLILHTTTPIGNEDTLSSTDIKKDEQRDKSENSDDMSFGMVVLVMIRYYLEQIILLLCWLLGLSHWISENNAWLISKQRKSATVQKAVAATGPNVQICDENKNSAQDHESHTGSNAEKAVSLQEID